MNDRRLNLLGLAQVAGGLVSGNDQVVEAINNRRAKLVIIASDASEATKKDFRSKCEYHHLRLNDEFSMIAISHALGKKRKVCALTDSGFVTSFLKKSKNNGVSDMN
ncbi:MAG: ribosomal L7Ae/L30e/S12e/Gadd45 family protein [Aerococcus sp.]|nr:ribosomal L7Ae/L30e/S12e/Gadd45 family protein [Aerococcus sp.]